MPAVAADAKSPFSGSNSQSRSWLYRDAVKIPAIVGSFVNSRAYIKQRSIWKNYAMCWIVWCAGKGPEAAHIWLPQFVSRAAAGLILGEAARSAGQARTALPLYMMCFLSLSSEACHPSQLTTWVWRVSSISTQPIACAVWCTGISTLFALSKGACLLLSIGEQKVMLSCVVKLNAQSCIRNLWLCNPLRIEWDGNTRA